MENLQTTRRQQEEINLISLIYYCLYQWKKMICVGVVLAICLCGYKTYSYYYVKNGEDKTGYDLEIEKYNIAKGQYDHSVESYQLSLQSMETAVETLTMEIDNAEKYCQESPKMQLDPMAYYKGELRLYVDTDYKIMPEMTYQNINKTPAVISSFITELRAPVFLEELATACGFESMYIDDVYSINSSDNCFVYVSFIGPSEEFVNAGINAIKNEIENSTKDISVILGEFSTVLTDYGTVCVSAQEMLDYQENKRNEVINKESDLVKKKADLAKVEEPKKFSESKPSVLKNAIKSGLIGGFAGVLLVAMYAAITKLLGGKMLSSHDITEAYGVRNLGCFSSKSYKGLTKVFRKWEGKADGAFVDRDLKLIAQSVANNSKEIKGKILVTGSEEFSCAEDLIKEITTMFSNVQVVCGQSMITDVDTLAMVNDCEAIILVEKCYESKYSNIEKELQIAFDLGKEVLGVVVEE